MNRASLLRLAPLALIALIAARDSGATVRIKNGFSPSTVNISVGASVTWTNADDHDHAIASRDGTFSSDNLKPGESFSFTFRKAGTYAYGCPLHPRETGVVNVAGESGK